MNKFVFSAVRKVPHDIANKLAGLSLMVRQCQDKSINQSIKQDKKIKDHNKSSPDTKTFCWHDFMDVVLGRQSAANCVERESETRLQG